MLILMLILILVYRRLDLENNTYSMIHSFDSFYFGIYLFSLNFEKDCRNNYKVMHAYYI